MEKIVYSKCGMRCDLCLIYRQNVDKTWSDHEGQLRTSVASSSASAARGHVGGDVGDVDPDADGRVVDPLGRDRVVEVLGAVGVLQWR